MTGIWRLSLAHLAHRWGRAAILVGAIALTAALPVAVGLLVDRYERNLLARARATPLVAGAAGSRFDLVLAALYFRQSDLEPIEWGEYERLQARPGVMAIPLNVRFTARGTPIVATTVDYLEVRGLAVARGRGPLRVGEAVLGAQAARRLGLGPGETLFSDQPDVYDISRPPALRMAVVGVLAPTGRPDDAAVFVDIKTAWILEGAAHGHGEVRELDESLVIARAREHVAVSQAMIELNEVTPETASSFHVHGDRARLPLTAVLVFPQNDKVATIEKARLNAERLYQMVVPERVIRDLLAVVFRVEAFLDAVAVLLAVVTSALALLVILLSVRLREGEIRTLHRIGCGRGAVPMLIGSELAMILLAAGALAAAMVAVTLAVAPDVAGVL